MKILLWLLWILGIWAHFVILGVVQSRVHISLSFRRQIRVSIIHVWMSRDATFVERPYLFRTWFYLGSFIVLVKRSWAYRWLLVVASNIYCRCTFAHWVRIQSSFASIYFRFFPIDFISWILIGVRIKIAPLINHSWSKILFKILVFSLLIKMILVFNMLLSIVHLILLRSIHITFILLKICRISILCLTTLKLQWILLD